MSQSYKADSNDAKAVRRGIVEPRQIGGTQHHTKKPFRITGSIFFLKNYCIGKYATMKDAEKALVACQKKVYMVI